MLSILSGHFYGSIYEGMYDKCPVNILGWVIGVPLFVMITGYFLIDKPLKSVRILKVAILTMFYCFTLNVVMKLMGHPITIYDFVKSIFPFGPTKYNYWFITKYLALMTLLPFMSILSRNMDQRKHQILLCVLLLLLVSVTSVMPGLPFGGQFGDGWTLQWFVCLFFTGGYLKKYMRNEKYKTHFYTLAIVYVILMKLGVFEWLRLDEAYNGLITYLGSIVVLGAFLCMNISSDSNLGRLITWASPSVFAIYLIHTQANFSLYLYQLAHDLMDIGDNSVTTTVEMTLYCLTCFIAMILVDKIREYIFEKTGINKAILYLSERIDTSVNRWIHS
jgi:hypothetical protein